MPRNLLCGVAAAVVLAAVAVSCAGPTSESPGEVTVYSGRSLELVGPVIERFEQQTGVRVRVRDGDTAELAAQILEEGDNSPADVFFAQDAGALGALSKAGRLTVLDRSVLDSVPAQFRSPRGEWVGVSGRARVLAYKTGLVPETELPTDVEGLTAPRFRGRVGWAPTNGSFQSFVTAMRKLEGPSAARQWLEAMRANDAQAYEGNSAIVKAVAAGEVHVGLVNHYYLLQLSASDPAIADSADNHFFARGSGALVNVAGAGITNTARNPEAALALVEFLLSDQGQVYFATETFEYPMVAGVPADPRLPPLDSLDTPDVDLSDLDDLEGTLELMRSVGVLT